MVCWKSPWMWGLGARWGPGDPPCSLAACGSLAGSGPGPWCNWSCQGWGVGGAGGQHLPVHAVGSMTPPERGAGGGRLPGGGTSSATGPRPQRRGHPGVPRRGSTRGIMVAIAHSQSRGCRRGLPGTRAQQGRGPHGVQLPPSPTLSPVPGRCARGCQGPGRLAGGQVQVWGRCPGKVWRSHPGKTE